MRSLCNILITPNKKGDRYCSHHPKQLRIDPLELVAMNDQAGATILAIFFLITKT